MKKLENNINYLNEFYKQGIDSCINSFFCKKTGGIKHNPTEKKIAYKSTIRTALFFNNENTNSFEDHLSHLKSYANSILPKNENDLIIKRKGRDTFDSLLTILYWPIDFNKDIMLKELMSTIEILEHRQYNYSSPTLTNLDFTQQLPPHKINYYYLGKIFRKLSLEGMLDENLISYWKKIQVRCADEVSKQLGFLKCNENYSLDIGNLVFSLYEAKDILSDKYFITALISSIELLINHPNNNLSPYRIKDRDTVIRPLTEELFNIIFNILYEYEFENHHKPIDEELTNEFLNLFKSDITSRFTTIDNTYSGWTKERGVLRFHPEIFPTIATLEAIKSCIRFLRFHILLDLQNNYSFTISTKLSLNRPLDTFTNYPFNLYNILNDKFLKRTKKSWSSAILFGPPGTGKTSLVKSLAKILDWTFINITPSDLAQDGPSQIVNRARILLSSLTKIEKCIILMDEFDAFISSRDKENKDHWQALITNCMLPLLTELKENKNILFFMATNYVDVMDAAAIRDGRFDAIIPIWPLSQVDRQKIIKLFETKLDASAVTKKVYKSKGCTYGELVNKLETKENLDENIFLSHDNGKKWEDQLKYCRPKVNADSFE